MNTSQVSQTIAQPTTATQTTLTNCKESADPNEYLILPRESIAAKLSEAFRGAGIPTELEEGNTIELQNDEVGPITCEITQDPCELRLWGSFYLPSPKSDPKRAAILNILNAESIGARYYQDDAPEFLMAIETRLIGHEGLTCTTAVELTHRFIWQLGKAEKAIIAEGFYDDPSDSQEDDDGKGGQ